MKNRGFTLVEVMLSAAITTLLIALLVTIANSVGNAWTRGEAQAEVAANARGAINMLTRELQGAVVDLDLGFRVSTVSGEPNQYILRFLTRAEPTVDDQDESGTTTKVGTPAVRKICYQLGWADRRLLPRVAPAYSDAAPVPVLLRTESEDLSDVFEVKTKADADRWTRVWGELSGSTTAGEVTGSERVDIAAENVLGWQVIPYGWDGSQTVPDNPGVNPRYYDQFLTSDVAPRALEIKIAVLPSRAAARAANLTGPWSTIRSDAGLFNLESFAQTPFNDIVRREVKYFSTTIYLQSKTP